MQHGFVRVSPVFIINGQSPEVFKPGESALDNPSFWHGKKSVRLFVRPEYDIQVTTQQSLDRVPDSLAPVTSVARIRFSPGNLYLMDSNTSSAPTLSWTLAGWTLIDMGSPGCQPLCAPSFPLSFCSRLYPFDRQCDGRS